MNRNREGIFLLRVRGLSGQRKTHEQDGQNPHGSIMFEVDQGGFSGVESTKGGRAEPRRTRSAPRTSISQPRGSDLPVPSELGAMSAPGQDAMPSECCSATAGRNLSIQPQKQQGRRSRRTPVCQPNPSNKSPGDLTGCCPSQTLAQEVLPSIYFLCLTLL